MNIVERKIEKTSNFERISVRSKNEREGRDDGGGDFSNESRIEEKTRRYWITAN